MSGNVISLEKARLLLRPNNPVGKNAPVAVQLKRQPLPLKMSLQTVAVLSAFAFVGAALIGSARRG